MNVLIIFAVILICLVSIRNIHIGFAMIVAVDLLVPRAVSLFGMIPLRELFMMLAWLFFLFHGVLKKEYEFHFSGIYRKHFVIFSIGIFAILLFSSGVVGLGTQLKHIAGLIYYLSYAYIAWTIYNDDKGIKQFTKLMLLLSFVMTLYGIFCYVTISNPYLSMLESFSGKGIIGGIEFARGGLTGRIQGTMAHPISWAGCCGLLLLFFANNNAKIRNPVTFILIFLLAVNIFLTGSRSAILALLIGFVFLILWSREKKKILSIVIFGVIFLILILQIVPQLEQYKGMVESSIFFWNEDISSENEMKGSSTVMRLMQLLGSFDMIEDNLFFGLGHGFVDYYLSNYGLDPILYGFESIVYNKLVEGGLVDLFLWLYFFAVLFFSIEKLNKRLEYPQDTSILKTFVVFYFIYSLLTGFMHTFLCFIILYTVMVRGLTTASQKVYIDV